MQAFCRKHVNMHELRSPARLRAHTRLCAAVSQEVGPTYVGVMVKHLHDDVVQHCMHSPPAQASSTRR